MPEVVPKNFARASRWNIIGAEYFDLGNGDSSLSLLYEAYNELNDMDSEQIRADFEALYHAMHGMTLKEMDAVNNPICTLCR